MLLFRSILFQFDLVSGQDDELDLVIHIVRPSFFSPDVGSMMTIVSLALGATAPIATISRLDIFHDDVRTGFLQVQREGSTQVTNTLAVKFLCIIGRSDAVVTAMRLRLFA